MGGQRYTAKEVAVIETAYTADGPGGVNRGLVVRGMPMRSARAIHKVASNVLGVYRRVQCSCIICRSEFFSEMPHAVFCSSRCRLSPKVAVATVPDDVIAASTAEDRTKAYRAVLASRLAMLTVLTLSVSSVRAADLDSFLRALHRVETGGRVGRVWGDGGRSLGPLQIQRAYWLDSRVPGSWSRCADLAYSRRVAVAYFRRYEPQALARGDWETLARCHNGGPGWRRHRRATDGYWAKIRKEMR